jgi:hypothetical protein
MNGHEADEQELVPTGATAPTQVCEILFVSIRSLSRHSEATADPFAAVISRCPLPPR